MCPSYEFIVADYFCNALVVEHAAAVTTRAHLDYHEGQHAQVEPRTRRISTDERPVEVCGGAEVGKLVSKLAK